MANVVCEISVTQEPLAARVSDIAGAGAVVDFWGVVRPIEDGREIEGIDYEAHREMAEHQLKLIARTGRRAIWAQARHRSSPDWFYRNWRSIPFSASGESASERRLPGKSMDRG